MSSASNWLEVTALNHFFRNIPTPPPQPFIGLLISDPTDENIGTEVSGGNYERQPGTFTAPIQTELGKAQIENDAEIIFPVASANWGNITHFGIFTAATGGELMVHGAVPVPREIMAGDEAVYREGSLAITFD
ncbi:MAG: hypothetical protein FWB91_01955 [Defluviitaleaceae bacterium]|nr:hypothetical protein [Defluviitaleaceae bacterium]